MAAKTAHVFIGDKNWTKDESHLQSTEEQLELFLIKYPSMDRDNLKYIVESLFDEGGRISQVLAEENLNSIMDDIGCELDPARVKAFVAKCHEGKATFTAIACMIFNKPYEDSNVFHDPEAEARTKAAESKAKAVTDRITTEKEAERKEQEDRKKLEDKIRGGLEKVGVAGKAALFEQKSLKKDDPFTQAQKVRHENALKKEQKEAEIKLAQAKEEEEARAKIIEAEAAEAKKQVKVAALADKMAKFGINVASPTGSDKK